MGDKILFHCGGYFINKTEQMEIKWGTDSKVQYVEPLYGFQFPSMYVARVTYEQKIVGKINRD